MQRTNDLHSDLMIFQVHGFSNFFINSFDFCLLDIFLDKLCIWSLTFTLYINLVPNILIISIWSNKKVIHIEKYT